MPLAWGAKVHANTCRWDLLYVADPWGLGGIFALGLEQQLSFSWEVILMAKSVSQE